jgi:hypothetical protein
MLAATWVGADIIASATDALASGDFTQSEKEALLGK